MSEIENRLWIETIPGGRYPVCSSTESWRASSVAGYYPSVAGEALQLEERLLRIALRSEELAVRVGRVGLEAAADLVRVAHVEQRIGARGHDCTCAVRAGGVARTALGERAGWARVHRCAAGQGGLARGERAREMVRARGERAREMVRARGERARDGGSGARLGVRARR